MSSACVLEYAPTSLSLSLSLSRALSLSLSLARSLKVLLGTPEVFRSSLVDSRHLHVTDMSLCVFDECHHANGNSSMACMLRDALNSRQVASSKSTYTYIE